MTRHIAASRARGLALALPAADAAAMPFSARVLLAAACCVSLRAQAPCTLQVDGALGGVRVLGEAHWEGAGASLQRELPSGTWSLRFFPDQGLRPAPLELEAPANGFVHVAVERGISTEPEVTLTKETNGPQVFADASGVRVRLSARVRVRRDGPAIGIAARVDGDDQYRFVFAPKLGELHLLRAMSGPARVMRKCAAPELAADAQWHDLELEVDGFRIACYCDGALVLRALDGGPIGGVCATFVEGGAVDTEPCFRDVTTAEPTSNGASLAAVRSERELTVFARDEGAAGCPVFFCLRLDRAVPRVLDGDDGLETFLLQRPLEPWFLPFGGGFVDRDGEAKAKLAWPDLAMLRGQAALVGAFVGSRDASARGRTWPWAAAQF